MPFRMVWESSRETPNVQKMPSRISPQQQRSRADGAAESAAGGEEQGDAGNHGGKSAVAGNEIVGEDGDEPFPWGVQ